MKLSYVIPTYNEKGIALTETCLHSLRTYHPISEVIVVDDGSSQEVIKDLEKICLNYNAKLLYNFHNQGFSHTVNRGIEQATGDIVILTNNDIVFTENIEDEIVRKFTEDDKIGIMGFLLFFPDDTVQHGGHYRMDKTENMHHVEPKVPRNQAKLSYVSRYNIGVTGALQAIRKSMTNKIGAYSTKYQMAFEDVEFCLRAWHCGYHVWYAGNVSAIHAEGVTRGNDPQSKMIKRTWEAEQKSRIQYSLDVKKYSFDAIDNKILQLNMQLKCKDSIGVIRMNALGDCIIATGIIKELKKRNPDKNIFICTKHTYPFLNNEFITGIFSEKEDILKYCSKTYDLDLCYESSPKKHRLNSYADFVFGEKNYTREDIRPFINLYVKHILEVNHKYVVIHPSATWASRTLSKEVWDKVVDYLLSKNLIVISIGTEKDIKLTPKNNFHDLSTTKQALNTIHYLIDKAKMFVGIDSGMMHIAQCTDTPIVGIFSVANPDVVKYRLDNFYIVEPTSKCKFCLQDKTEPVISIDCETNECINSVTAESIIDAIKEGGI